MFRQHDALLVEGPRIAALDRKALGTGVQQIDLDGAVIVPAFADCHVHLTDTGYYVGKRSLVATRSYADYVRAIDAIDGSDAFLLAGNYDESTWADGAHADAAPLEARHAERHIMLTRVDGHSCIVNRKTFRFLNLDASLRGIERAANGEPTGRLFLEANWRAQTTFLAAIPLAARRAAEKRALDVALAQGAVHLHAQLIGFSTAQRYGDEIAALRALSLAKIYPKICEADARIAAALGLPYIGGDVFLDGSIGSATAAVGEPYCDRAGNGALAMSDEALSTYFSVAQELGISAGVHAIGDRAIEQCIATWERVLAAHPARTTRHFIEHFEIASPAQIARCAQLGIFLSMQPAFDFVWGGTGALYEQRLGRERTRTMNALASALRAGAVVCGGDDSPVCELSPLGGMHAALHHHNAAESIDAAAALTMYTYSAARLAHVEDRTGTLAPGSAADFVVLDSDPIANASFAGVSVLQTWVDGACAYQR